MDMLVLTRNTYHFQSYFLASLFLLHVFLDRILIKQSILFLLLQEEMLAQHFHQLISLFYDLHKIEIQGLGPSFQLLCLCLIKSIVLVQSFVEIALQFSHSFVQDFPAHICLLCLCEYLGELFDLLAEFECQKLDRLYTEAQTSFYLSENPKNVLNSLLLLSCDVRQLANLPEVFNRFLKDLSSLEEMVELWLRLLRVLPCEYAIEIPSGKHSGIRQHLIVPFDVRKMHLLLEQKFIQFRIFATVRVSNEIVQVLTNKEEAMFWALLESKGIVDIKDRDDKASVFLRHVLDQMLDLQELAHSDLNTLIRILQIVIDEKQLFLLRVLTAQLDLQPDTIQQRLSVTHGLFTFITHDYNLSSWLCELQSLLRIMQGKENQNRSMLSLTLDEKNIDEAMEILFAHQKNCEKTGKYMEADAAKKRLAKMKSELERQRRGELVQRFEQERKEVEAAHQEEMEEFNQYWDGKFLEYQQEAERVEGETLDKHDNERAEFQAVVEQSIPMGKRETSQMINLRKVQEQLAKQEEYVEAHKIQRQIAEIERKENERWMGMRNTKIRNLLVQLQGKQDIQLSALRQKITQGFEQQKKLRKCEQDKLLQKYCNFLKELENKHNQEIIKLQKSFKMQSTMSFSRSQATSRVLQNKN